MLDKIFGKNPAETPTLSSSVNNGAQAQSPVAPVANSTAVSQDTTALNSALHAPTAAPPVPPVGVPAPQNNAVQFSSNIQVEKVDPKNLPADLDSQDKKNLEKVIKSLGLAELESKDAEYNHVSIIRGSDNKIAKIVLNLDGIRTAKNYFGMGGIFEKIKAIFGKKNNAGMTAYKEYYKELNSQVDQMHEEPKHLMKSFKDNHYHSTIVLKKDEKGKIDIKTPESITVTDSYYYLASMLKEIGLPEEAVKQEKDKFRHAYVMDKVIQLDKNVKFEDTIHTVAESLKATQKFDMLAIRSAVHQNPVTKSHDLIYEQMPWKFMIQHQDSKWENPQGTITVIRPLVNENQALAPELASFELASEITSGKQARASGNKEQELAKESMQFNLAQVQAFNANRQNIMAAQAQQQAAIPAQMPAAQQQMPAPAPQVQPAQAA